MRTMQGIIDDMRDLSKQFEKGTTTYEHTMKEMLKLKKELQDRADLISMERSAS